MRECRQAFFKQDFVMSYETTKSMEFEKRGTGEVIYLLMNKAITIVRDPDWVEDTADWQPVHNTSLRRFRKKTNQGQTPISYGYPVTFNSAEELSTYLEKEIHQPVR
ncbi:hypothetical protein JF544_01530 [Halobacillus kuroshimensis]|uniref:Uncharacterized protein n=2 Tax=Halobacillus kuroshimensis TaxID=302481 RepID=A0ABS3DRH0_9BACI|nr:hypothetical protein [Halobacillus kuroshimensis]